MDRANVVAIPCAQGIGSDYIHLRSTKWEPKLGIGGQSQEEQLYVRETGKWCTSTVIQWKGDRRVPQEV